MNITTNHIYTSIVELSDLDLQRKLWLNENNETGLISSYTEVMCSLFDDNCLDEFIDVTVIKMGFSNEMILELDVLRVLLNDYQDKEFDEDIINDKHWQKIVEQAKIVIKKWKAY